MDLEKTRSRMAANHLVRTLIDGEEIIKRLWFDNGDVNPGVMEEFPFLEYEEKLIIKAALSIYNGLAEIDLSHFFHRVSKESYRAFIEALLIKGGLGQARSARVVRRLPTH